VYTPQVTLNPQLWKVLPDNLKLELRLSVGPNGRVVSVQKPQAAHDVVTQAIVAAVSTTAASWRFRPATVNGTPVPGEYLVTFEFNGSQRGVKSRY